jgi:hypothetical protein
MAKSDYVNKGDQAFSAQTQTFKNNIGGYATLLGVTPEQIAWQAADANYFAYTLQCQAALQNGAQQWTSWKDLARDGGASLMEGAPATLILPLTVAAVVPGIEARFRALVKQIKAHPNYNQSIGEALGVEGAQQAGPDLATIQPQIAVKISGNHVAIDWGWQGYVAYLDMCEIQVDRADGNGFVFLTHDTTPGYNDPTPFPSMPVKWTYRAIYRVGDGQVGRWSNVVTITVGV